MFFHFSLKPFVTRADLCASERENRPVTLDRGPDQRCPWLPAAYTQAEPMTQLWDINSSQAKYHRHPAPIPRPRKQIKTQLKQKVRLPLPELELEMRFLSNLAKIFTPNFFSVFNVVFPSPYLQKAHLQRFIWTDLKKQHFNQLYEIFWHYQQLHHFRWNDLITPACLHKRWAFNVSPILHFLL